MNDVTTTVLPENDNESGGKVPNETLKSLVFVAAKNLASCPHPRLRVAGDQCTRCGATFLRDSGWVRPTMLQAIAELIEATTYVDGGS